MNNIVLKLQGGMGNQMFQYAFGRKIQEKTGRKLILDISDYKYDKAGRKYALGSFMLPKTIEIDSSGKYNYKYDQRKNWIIKLFVKLFPEALFRIGKRFGIYIWEDIRFLPFEIDTKFSDIYIHGLWQSEKYFYEIKNVIKKELRVAGDLQQTDKELIEKMKKVNSVCVHIRRGDFLSSNNNLEVCELEYYHRAMNFIQQSVDNPFYFIFSDDPEWAKNNLGSGNAVIVSGSRMDYDEFRLMCNCENYIISNSTFSWWASYIGNNGGIVVAPKWWYSDSTDYSGLIRTDMFCVDNR